MAFKVSLWSQDMGCEKAWLQRFPAEVRGIKGIQCSFIQGLMKHILSVWIRVRLCLVDWLKHSWDLLQLNAMKAKKFQEQILRIKSQAAICLMSYFFHISCRKQMAFSYMSIWLFPEILKLKITPFKANFCFQGHAQCPLKVLRNTSCKSKDRDRVWYPWGMQYFTSRASSIPILQLLLCS